jgi:hypothetical protein
MSRRRLPREEIIEFRDRHYPKGASSALLAEKTWPVLITDEDKHHLAWVAWVRHVAETVSQKDRQGLPMSIPTNDTDAGGRIFAPLRYASYQQVFDYFEECVKAVRHDLDALRILWDYMDERWGQAPPMPELRR